MCVWWTENQQNTHRATASRVSVPSTPSSFLESKQCFPISFLGGLWQTRHTHSLSLFFFFLSLFLSFFSFVSFACLVAVLPPSLSLFPSFPLSSLSLLLPSPFTLSHSFPPLSLFPPLFPSCLCQDNSHLPQLLFISALGVSLAMSSMDADEEYGPKVPASLDQHNANQEGNGQGADQGSDASAPGDNSSNSSGSPDSTANPNDKSSAATSTASDSQAGAVSFLDCPLFSISRLASLPCCWFLFSTNTPLPPLSSSSISVLPMLFALRFASIGLHHCQKQKDQVYTVLPLDRVNDVRSSMRMGTQIPIAEGSPFKVLVAAYIEAQKNGW